MGIYTTLPLPPLPTTPPPSTATATPFNTRNILLTQRQSPTLKFAHTRPTNPPLPLPHNRLPVLLLPLQHNPILLRLGASLPLPFLPLRHNALAVRHRHRLLCEDGGFRAKGLEV